MAKRLFGALYRWIRRNPLIIFWAIVISYIVIAKLCFEEAPEWYRIIYFVLSGVAFKWICNQLPRKKYRSLSILLFTFFGIFLYAYLAVIPSDEGFEWLAYVLMALTFGYGSYSAWRWWALTRYLIDVKQRRELRALRKRNV